MDDVIDRYQHFWSMYTHEADFVSQSKVLRGLITYLKAQYVDISDYVEMVTEMSEELHRYLPLMDLDEFVAASKAVVYARRVIKNADCTDPYAGGLSREITDDERRQLSESLDEGDRDRAKGVRGEDDSSGNDMLDLLDDDDEP